MALSPRPIINFPARDPWKSPNAVTRLPGVAASRHLLSVILGRTDPSDGESRRVCARNRAELARNADGDMVLFGAPQISDHYWTFAAGDRIQTNITEPASFCGFVVCRSTDPDLGTATTARSPVFGNFQNTQSRGLSVMGRSLAAYQAFVYGGSPVAIQSAQLTIPSGTVNLWRILYFEVTGDHVSVINMSADGAENTVSTAFASGRTPGSLPFAVGDYSNGAYLSPSDIHRVEMIEGVLTAPERAAVVGSFAIRGHLERNTNIIELSA